MCGSDDGADARSRDRAQARWRWDVVGMLTFTFGRDGSDQVCWADKLRSPKADDGMVGLLDCADCSHRQSRQPAAERTCGREVGHLTYIPALE
jgi:hypothetical protein